MYSVHSNPVVHCVNKPRCDNGGMLLMDIHTYIVQNTPTDFLLCIIWTAHTHPVHFLGRRRRPYIVFRNRFLCGFMSVYIYIYIYIYIIIYIYVYICQDGGAVGFVDFTKLSFALFSLT